MARSGRYVTGLLAGAVITVVVACASTTVAPDRGPSVPGPTAPPASGPSTAPTGSMPLPGMTPPTPTGGPVGSPSGPPVPKEGCLRGMLRVLYPGADTPLRSSCVHAGADIVITLAARPPYRWSPVTSSQPDVVVQVSSRVNADGSTVTTLRALRAGTATLSSANSFTPDPDGPPSHPWQLLVTVRP